MRSAESVASDMGVPEIEGGGEIGESELWAVSGGGRTGRDGEGGGGGEGGQLDVAGEEEEEEEGGGEHGGDEIDGLQRNRQQHEGGEERRGERASERIQTIPVELAPLILPKRLLRKTCMRTRVHG